MFMHVFFDPFLIFLLALLVARCIHPSLRPTGEKQEKPSAPLPLRPFSGAKE
jgi:hypothetical protein